MMTGETIAERICKMTEELLSVEKVNPSNTLAEMGFDSILFIRLVVLIETTFSVHFEDEKLLLSQFHRLEDIIQYVEALHRQTSS